MSDLPLKELGGKTPLQYAATPNMDWIAKNGQTGLIKTVPDGFKPGSDVANLSVLGYDPRKYYTGRGPIEAVSIGIDIPDGQIAFRCNLVTIQDETMVDFTAGHISTEESAELLAGLNNQLQFPQVRFYAGTSYRNMMLIDDAFLDLECVPPHDITDKQVTLFLPKGTNQIKMQKLMADCRAILNQSVGNKKRQAAGKRPATDIWPWGQGKPLKLPSFKSVYGIEGGIVTAVDLLKGIGKLAGLETPSVQGATGLLDTSYHNKMQEAYRILKVHDFVYIHIEAPDEMGHMGSVENKIKAIEDFDKNIVGSALAFQKEHSDVRMMVLPDHPTPCSLKTHTADPVPVCMFYQGIKPDASQCYGEASVASGVLKFNYAWELLSYFINNK